MSKTSRQLSCDYRKALRQRDSNFETKTFDDLKPTSEIVTDSLVTNYYSIPKRSKRNTASYASVSIMPTQSSQVLSLPPTGEPSFARYKRVTRNYVRFLQEKELIDRRSEERNKIKQDLKKSFAGGNPNVFSKDVQELITSSKMYELNKRPKQTADNNNNKVLITQTTTNVIDDLHKQISYRMFGGDFENNEVFQKNQADNNNNDAMERTGGAFLEKLNLRISSRTKISPIPSLKLDMTPSNPSSSQNERKRVKKSMTIPAPTSLASIRRGKSSDNYGSSSKIKSLSSLNSLERGKPPRSQREIISLNELEVTPCQQSDFGSRDIEEAQKEFKIKSLESLRRESHSRGSQNRESGTTSNVERFQSNLYRNLKATSRAQRTNMGFHSLTSRDLTETKSRIALHSEADETSKKGVVDEISKLCTGIIKSSSKLGSKLLKQKTKLGNDFKKLDVQMEKFRYVNTLKSWEKSLKQVENIEQKSPFFNILL